MADLSTALKEAFARSKTSTRSLTGIQMVHPQFPGAGGTMNFVNYDEDITLDGVIHAPVAMEVMPPESGDEPDDKISFRIDGVPGDVQYWVNRAITTGTNIEVNLRNFAFNMDTKTVIDIVGVYNFLLLRCQYNAQAVVMDLGRVSPTNQNFPGWIYDAHNSPELF